MIAHCIRQWPYEACGALFAPIESFDPEAIRVVPIANIAQAAHREFVFDPAQWVQALCEAEQIRYRLQGLFHSHPNAPASPSSQDIANAPAGTPQYWIISLADRANPDVRLYRLTQWQRIDHQPERMLLPVPYRLIQP
jgi:proteasome lid subunit RPN8/RPN11